MLPRRSMDGRRKRSLKGLCSSTSSSVRALSAVPPPPYAVSRCCTISAVFRDGVRARPMKIISTPKPAISANRSVLFNCSYLDRDHAPDDQVANEDHEGADHDQDPADEVLEHWPEVRRRDKVHEGGEHDGQEGDQGSRRSRLSGQRRDLTFDPYALADGVGDVVKDLREVPTDCAMDRVGGGDEVEVGAHDALGDVRQRLVRRAAQVHLANRASELV